MRYPEILSLGSPPTEVAYSTRDTILYALAVGAGDDPVDSAELSFVYEKGLRTLPTMSTTLLGGDGSAMRDGGINLRMILHSEQRLRIHYPLPPEGRVRTASRIVGVADKGKEKGAVVYGEHTISDAASGLLYATVVLTLYCRGDGGFGGPNDDIFTLHPAPTRQADCEVSLSTAPNQAALYRLAIGDTNPLHIDPKAALELGFEKPLLHGMCTYGFACRAVMKAHCENDPTWIRSFDARFAAPFFPGETLVTRTWKDGDLISFEARSAERGVVVLKNGRCDIAD